MLIDGNAHETPKKEAKEAKETGIVWWSLHTFRRKPKKQGLLILHTEEAEKTVVTLVVEST